MKNQKRKSLFIGMVCTTMLTTLGVVVYAVGNNSINSLSANGNQSQSYELNLNSSNKVTSNGDHIQKTGLNNNVTFTYSGVANSTSGHVTLNNGGKIVNKDNIRSIESMMATFNVEDSLSFRVSYDGATWSGSTTMTSDYRCYLDSNPYFIEFSASKTVTVNSINFKYSCAVNPTAAGTEVQEVGGINYQKVTSKTNLTDGKYLIVYESGKVAFDGSLTTLDATDNNFDITFNEETVSSSTDTEKGYFTIASSGNKYTIKSKSNYYIGATGNSNSLNSSTTTEYLNDISFENNGSATIKGSGGAYLRYNSDSSQARFRYFKSSSYSSQQEIALYKRIETQSGSHIEYETPNDIVGFSATDSKANDYNLTDVFDNANALVVKAKYMDGTLETLTKGASGYSYQVFKNGSSTPIDTSKAFGEAGTYNLVVSYKKYTPVQIELTVSEKITQETTYTFTSASWGATPSNWVSGKDGDDYIDNRGIKILGNASANGTSPASFSGVKQVVVKGCTNASGGAGTISVKIGNNSAISKSIDSAGGSTLREFTYDFASTQNGTINISASASANSIYIYSVKIVENVTPTDPTDLSIQSELELVVGGSKKLDVTYTPANANRNLDVTWESNNASVATVENGTVTVRDSATVGQTATITATLNRDNTKTSQCVVTVVEEQKDAYTIMIYMCGSDLESGGEDDYGEYDADYYGGYASEDIKEILSVSGQPEDVNIIIETGGAGAWASTYDIKNDMLGRWEIKNKSLINVDYLSNASMGEKNTFKSFLEWGLTDYPAEKTAVILWNHGGAMRGACYDENFNKNSLLVSETTEAFKEVLGDNKLEWIGYDCCLMQVQDIAEQNSKYFKYMVASEESEAGYGWEYNTWIDDVYAGHDIDTTLTAICDGFVNSYNGSGNDQTLSYLDLSKINKYYTAWEDMSDSLYDLINSYGKTNFQNLMKTVKEYGTTIYTASQLTQAGYSTNPSNQYYYGNYGIVQIGNKYYDYGYTYFGIFDAADFLNKISNIDAFNDAQNEIDSVLEAINELIVYNKIGGSAGNSNGLCMYFPLGRWCQIETYYQKNVQTNFVKWWKIVNDFGINS